MTIKELLSIIESLKKENQSSTINANEIKINNDIIAYYTKVYNNTVNDVMKKVLA